MKPLSDFYANRKGPAGCASRCKRCANKASYASRRAKAPGQDDHRYNSLICNARNSAKKRSLAFDLDEHKAEIRDRVRAGRCELTGLHFNLAGGLTYDSPSIDRIEPEQGYVYSNIRIICYGMNAALGRWGEGALRTMVEAWLAQK